jgi:hypothetical protein
MGAANPAMAAIQGAASVAQIGLGVSQLLKAKKLERNNVRPNYDIQKEYFANQGMAENMAQMGMTQPSIDFANSQANNNFNLTSDALLQTGQGGLNGILAANANLLNFQKEMAAKSSEMQTNKILNLMQQNETLAGQKMQQWTYNKVQPYDRNLATIAQERNAGTQNIFGGLGSAVKGLAANEQSKLTNTLMDYYKQPKPTGTTDNTFDTSSIIDNITNSNNAMADLDGGYYQTPTPTYNARLLGQSVLQGANTPQNQFNAIMQIMANNKTMLKK